MSEQEARLIIGEEKTKWLDENGFHWDEQLPYSMQEGWTNGWCSYIFVEDKEGGTYQSLEEMKRHWEYVKADRNFI